MEHRFRTAQWLPYPVDFVFAFFANPANLPGLFPNWQQTRIDEIALQPAPLDSPNAQPGIIAAGAGSRVTLSFRPFPLSPVRLSWVALIEDFRWNQRFCDRQLRGPFRYWRQCHRVEASLSPETGEPGTLLIDVVEYSLPRGVLGRLGKKAVRKQIETAFRFRQQRIAESLRELSQHEESLV